MCDSNLNGGEIKLTVGIPVYNAQDYIIESVESVLNQTVSPYEIILFDDGSTDRSGLLCASLLDKSPLIKVVHSCNLGPFLARRQIVKMAKGSHIIFLDSDDMLRRDTIESCVSVIREYNSDIVCFDYSYHEDYREGRRISGLDAGLYTGKKYESNVKMTICKGFSNQLCGKAIKKSLFDLEEDYSDCTHFRHAEDLFQILPIIDRAHSLFYLQSPLYYYRRSDQSGTFHFNQTQLKDLDRTAKRLLAYGKKWQLKVAATQGLIFQYCYLLKISFFDKDLDPREKLGILKCIRERIVGLSAYKVAISSMDFKWKVFTFMVLRNSFLGVKGLLFLEERHKGLN